MKKTKKAFVEYLNQNPPDQGSEQWIIGGKIRMSEMWQKDYGNAIRKFDPIQFEVGYNEWVKNKS